MDDLDLRIIGELKKNSRETNTKIASNLGISEGTVRNRISNLVKQRVLHFSVQEVKKHGFEAVILLTVDATTGTSEVAETVSNFQGVTRVLEVSGSVDIIIQTSNESPSKFNDLIEKIRRVKGVNSSESLVVLKTF
ncbi:HTH-type transcriptional regulator LysM [uncultured archaeon]|nr:HTH-type transcriptional regulator LysM [uncultured archaeon]